MRGEHASELENGFYLRQVGAASRPNCNRRLGHDLMATFDVWLVGSKEPFRVEFLAATVDDLAEEASRKRFLVGRLAESEGDGWLRAVMIQSYRVQCASSVD